MNNIDFPGNLDDLMLLRWEQGYTILTPVTRKWTKEELETNDKIEATRVFAYQQSDDQGRSRFHIATCQESGMARMIVTIHNKLLDKYYEAIK